MKAHQPAPKTHSATLASKAKISRSPLQQAATASPKVRRLAALQMMANQSDTTQRLKTAAPMLRAAAAARPNNTGLPDTLKSGIENLSGLSMDHVKVHRNSAKPAQLQAHAYAQGGDIHLGPGQERHLPHEAWHVVQQAQGRVKPTMQLKGIGVNDDAGLEAEADMMGAKAAQLTPATGLQIPKQAKHLSTKRQPIQRAGLKKNKLNVVGEEHNLSGARREDEKNYIESLGFNRDSYWQEGAFEYDRAGATPADDVVSEGDPFIERAEFQLLRAKEKAQYMKDILNEGPMPGESQARWIRYLRDEWKRAGRKIISDQVENNLLWAEQSERLSDYGNAVTLRRTINAFIAKCQACFAPYITGTDYSRNTILADLEAGNDASVELRAACDALIALVAEFEADFGRTMPPESEDISLQRSRFMHTAAQEAHQKAGVWKVGNRHAQHMQAFTDNKQYNLLEMNEFWLRYKFWGWQQWAKGNGKKTRMAGN